MATMSISIRRDGNAMTAVHDNAALPAIPSLVFENRTIFPALHFNTVDQYGAAFHVFVLRQTYRITPATGGDAAALVLASTQLPLATEDAYHDDDPQAGVARESDLAPYKPCCDIVVNATAHAPRDIAAKRFDVGLTVHAPTGPDGFGNTAGSQGPDETLIDKKLEVLGERRFERRSMAGTALRATVTVGTLGAVKPAAWHLTSPMPFVRLPIRYDAAAGGACLVAADDPAAARIPKPHLLLADGHRDPAVAAHEAAETNPLGRGFARAWYVAATGIEAVPAPRVIYKNQDFSAQAFAACLKGAPCPPPAGFGFIGRAWLPRRLSTGTIHVKRQWAADDVPRLPEDFDYAYWNGAPRDQQCRHLRGGERITLTNLCSPAHPAAHQDDAGDTVLRLSLPRQMVFGLAANAKELGVVPLAIDTVSVDPEAARVDLVWRAVLPATGHFEAFRLMQVAQPEQMERVRLLLDVQEGREPNPAALEKKKN